MQVLKYKTPDSWASSALENIFSLLSDHAYLERKAATNALDLLNRWPEPQRPKNWVLTLSSIARDEASHLHLVTRLLEKRRGRLERSHKSQYASDLRTLVRAGLTPEEVTDRLLVSSLIEARSCERFEILSRCAPDRELREFYRRLSLSEKNHFRLFLQLAEQLDSKEKIKKRWEEMLSAEAKIIQAQPVGPRLHSGLPI